jgi:DNA-binding transcriptional MerR regulator
MRILDMKWDYTLADIVRITGAKQRSIQLWADAGVIRADTSTERRGTGTHRRFSRNEAIIASIINVFSKRQVAIGELQRLASALRRFLQIGTNRRRIEIAVSEVEHEIYLVISWRADKLPDVDICEMDTIADRLSFDIGPKFEAYVLISLYSLGLSRLEG